MQPSSCQQNYPGLLHRRKGVKGEVSNLARHKAYILQRQTGLWLIDHMKVTPGGHRPAQPDLPAS